jgi:hypothetical protein
VSTALAIAGVSAVLRDLLNDGLINHNVNGALGSAVSVTTPPDRVATGEGTEATQLNLFLMRVTPNLGFRNEGLPWRDGAGNRLGNPPLALDLHYLVTAYGSAPLHAEILLGYAMQLLHENPVISRKAIGVALNPSPDVGTSLPPALRALASSGLENQLEQLKVTPEYLNSEELSKFWTASQARFRPSAAYEVSVVLIQATEPALSPLPVLTRQAFVRPDLLPPLPALDSVVPAEGQPVARLGTPITLDGHRLDGSGRTVTLSNERFQIVQTLNADPPSADGALVFSVPIARALDFPVGAYRVFAGLQPSGETRTRETNSLTLIIAPELTGLPFPSPVKRDPSGVADFGVAFHPALREGQSVSLLLGQQEFTPNAFVAPTTTLSFTIPNAPVGNHLARLRIDGIDSPIVDRNAQPPTFRNQRIEIQ